MDGGKVKTCKALYTNITSSERRYKVVYPSTLSRDGADLISKLLIKAQSKRMRSFGLLRSPFLGPFIRGHPFFGEVNWENMEAGDRIRRSAGTPVSQSIILLFSKLILVFDVHELFMNKLFMKCCS